jgi:hypothetical protein
MLRSKHYSGLNTLAMVWPQRICNRNPSLLLGFWSNGLVLYDGTQEDREVESEDLPEYLVRQIKPPSFVTDGDPFISVAELILSLHQKEVALSKEDSRSRLVHPITQVPRLKRSEKLERVSGDRTYSKGRESHLMQMKMKRRARN